MNPIANFKTLSKRAQFVIVVFGLAGLLLAGWSTLAGAVPPYGRLAALTLMGAITAHAKVKLSKTSTLSLLTSVVMFSLMMEGTVAAFAVGIAGVTVQAYFPSRKFIVHRFIFNAAMVVLAIHAASVPYYWITSQSLGGLLIGQLLGIIAASLTYYAGNSLSVSLIVAITECKSIFHVWFDHFLMAAPSFLSAGLLSLVVVEIVGRTVLGAAILLPLLYISYKSVRMAGRRSLIPA